VSDLGLSPAALDVDDAVRGDVADSNVRETVKRRIADRLDDPTSFEPAAQDHASGSDDADERDSGSGAATADTSTDEPADTPTDEPADTGPEPDAEGDATDAPPDDDAVDADTGDERVDPDPDSEEDESDADTDTPDSEETSERATDGQVSMEDFL
jgi:hypothetical protein